MIETLNRKYKVIYADPPWHFKSFSKKGEGRSAVQHYDCMDLDSICRLPVSSVADDNSVLLMWVTDPYLQQAFNVMRSWDFTYKTVGFTWVKTNKSEGSSSPRGQRTRMSQASRNENASRCIGNYQDQFLGKKNNGIFFK